MNGNWENERVRGKRIIGAKKGNKKKGILSGQGNKGWKKITVSVGGRPRDKKNSRAIGLSQWQAGRKEYDIAPETWGEEEGYNS